MMGSKNLFSELFDVFDEPLTLRIRPGAKRPRDRDWIWDELDDALNVASHPLAALTVPLVPAIRHPGNASFKRRRAEPIEASRNIEIPKLKMISKPHVQPRECDKPFSVAADVRHFNPDEISVRVSDGYLVVEGQHQERRDEHGLISRQFTRKFELPDNIDMERMECNLGKDGILRITAPRFEPIKSSERVIPINFVGESGETKQSPKKPLTTRVERVSADDNE
jgi:HSP20 family molecular chaperone IbpA